MHTRPHFVGYDKRVKCHMDRLQSHVCLSTLWTHCVCVRARVLEKTKEKPKPKRSDVSVVCYYYWNIMSYCFNGLRGTSFPSKAVSKTLVTRIPFRSMLILLFIVYMSYKRADIRKILDGCVNTYRENGNKTTINIGKSTPPPLPVPSVSYKSRSVARTCATIP